MVYRTLKDWNKRGKMVKAGSRATAWTNCGDGLFSQHQVKDFEKKPSLYDRVFLRIGQ